MIQFDKSRVNILVTDDESSIREMLGITLREDGWNVELAENGKVALEKLATKHFHIVLSDIQMPEVSGIELLEAGKKKFPNVEFIIMTSNATLDTAISAIKAGAYDYLMKPFEDLSFVSKKMVQVTERIMLRQQNNELMKRLQRAAKHLKNLFDSSRDLSGVLKLEELRKSVLQSLPRIFEEDAMKAVWLSKKENHFEIVEALPSREAVGEVGPFASLDDVKQKLSNFRSLRVDEFQFKEQPTEILAFENLNASLADLFISEVQTCFQKVSLHEEVLSMANRDGLTRLHNHRYFQERLRQELAIVKRQNAQLSVILMDVDHFKKYNDSHGHPAGDALLKQLAQLLDSEAGKRESDVVARYGGEEFVMLLPFTPHEGALTKAERIREAVANFAFEHREKQPLGCVSLSIGVATFPEHAGEPAELIEAADKALYQAKHQGRNRVVGCSQIPATTADATTTSSDVPSTKSETVAASTTQPEPSPTPVVESQEPAESHVTEEILSIDLSIEQTDSEKTDTASGSPKEVQPPSEAVDIDSTASDKIITASPASQNIEKAPPPTENIQLVESPQDAPPARPTLGSVLDLESTGPQADATNPHSEIDDLLSSIDLAYQEAASQAETEVKPLGEIPEVEVDAPAPLEWKGGAK